MTASIAQKQRPAKKKKKPSKKMAKSAKYILAFGSGIAAGAAIGILFAPGAGAETRDRLSYQLERYRDKLRELTESLIDGRDNAPSTAKSEGERVVRDARSKAEALLGDVDSLINQINSQKGA